MTPMLYLISFISTVWFAGFFAQLIQIPSILGEIMAGIMFGPNGFNLVEFSECLKVIGRIGIGLMMFESGFHLNMKSLKKYFLSSLGIALLGDILSFGSTIGIMYLFTGELHYLAGIVMMPTSIGIASNQLSKYKRLDSDFGQIILSAAFIDDLIGIVALSTSRKIMLGETDTWNMVSSGVCGIVFTIFSILVAKFITIGKLLQKIKDIYIRDNVLVFSMMFFLIGFTYLGEFIGSELLGQFCAGLIFCNVDQVRRCWRNRIENIKEWLIRFFYASTIGFIVPVEQMWSLDSFLPGLMVGIIGGLITKFSTGLIKPTYLFLIGSSLIARGELSLLVLEEYQKTGWLSEINIARLAWSVMITLIVAPILFKYFLKRYIRKNACPGLIHHYRIQFEGVDHKTLKTDILSALNSMTIRIIRTQTLVEQDKIYQNLVVEKRGCYSETAEIKETLLKELGDPDKRLIVLDHHIV